VGVPEPKGYEPNVKSIFRRNPDYLLPGLPYVDGVEWLVLDDESTALAMYRTGQLDRERRALHGMSQGTHPGR
jgi:ABC-type oligopeptide transport system substrate-binding subunit